MEVGPIHTEPFDDCQNVSDENVYKCVCLFFYSEMKMSETKRIINTAKPKPGQVRPQTQN